MQQGKQEINTYQDDSIMSDKVLILKNINFNGYVQNFILHAYQFVSAQYIGGMLTCTL